MKIAVVTEFFPAKGPVEFTGGVEARTYHLVQYLKAKHQLELIYRPKEQVAAGLGSIWPRLKFQFQVYQDLRSLEIDVIEASNFTVYVPAWLAARSKQVPIVAWVADIYGNAWFKNFSLIPALLGYVQEWFLIKLPWQQMIAMSQTTADKLIKVGVPKDKITVIYGGVDIAGLNNLNVTKYKQPTIITLARLVSYKRIDDLIRAVAIVKTKVPSVQLLILGDGPERQRLEQLAKELNVTKEVHFYGNIAHPQAMEYLRRSSIFSLPSIVEGFGLVTVEAMAAGIPYVNSSIGPTIEITQNGKGGLLYEPQNHQQLAKQLVKLLTDRSLYAQKIKEGRSLARQYDWNVVNSQTEAVFKQAITSYRSKDKP